MSLNHLTLAVALKLTTHFIQLTYLMKGYYYEII